jgi:hypothetical protein
LDGNFLRKLSFSLIDPREAMRAQQQLVEPRSHFWSSGNCSKKQGGEKLFSAFCWLDSEKWLQGGVELLWFG